MTDNWLQIDDVSFCYNKELVLQNLVLELGETHKTLGIVGKSGVGKSTLLNLIAGFLKPDCGTINVSSEAVTRASAKRPVVFQDHNLFPWMTVLQNVAFGLKAKGIKLEKRNALASNLIQQVGLQGMESKLPNALSGGMQQRVGIARALVITPECMILDEPFGSLDDNTRGYVIDFYKQLLVEHQMHAIHVTHNVEEAVRCCSAVLVLKNATTHRLFSFADTNIEKQADRVLQIREYLSAA